MSIIRINKTVHCGRCKINPIDLNAFMDFCKTIVGQELDTIGGKARFRLQNLTDNDFYYQLSISDDPLTHAVTASKQKREVRGPTTPGS